MSDKDAHFKTRGGIFDFFLNHLVPEGTRQCRFVFNREVLTFSCNSPLRLDVAIKRNKNFRDNCFIDYEIVWGTAPSLIVEQFGGYMHIPFANSLSNTLLPRLLLIGTFSPLLYEMCVRRVIFCLYVILILHSPVTTISIRSKFK